MGCDIYSEHFLFILIILLISYFRFLQNGVSKKIIPGIKKNAMIKCSLFFLLALFLCGSSCKKLQDIDQSVLEKYFESNVINRDFVVTLAKNNTADLTSDYDGYIFVLLKADLYHGPLKATKGGNVYEGSWSSNEDYSKLIITLPASPPEFQFLSRSWRFTKKEVPTLKLAPWGSTDPIELYMTRQ